MKHWMTNKVCSVKLVLYNIFIARQIELSG